jgi:hypothetical protein
MVSLPERHQLTGDQPLSVEPIRKNTSAVMTTERWNVAEAPTRKDSSGTAPHSTNDAKVLAAAFSGDRSAFGQAVLFGKHGVDPAIPDRRW